MILSGMVRCALVMVMVSCGVLLPATVHNQPLGVTRPESKASGADRQRQKDLHRLATIGLVFGAIETEAALERAVERQLRDLRTATTAGRPGRTNEQLAGLQGVLERSRVALDLLDRGLELAVNPQSLPSSSSDYRRELRKRSQQSPPKTIHLMARSDSSSSSSSPTNHPSIELPVIERLVGEQLMEMRHRLAARIRRTVQHLQQQQQQDLNVAVNRLDIATVQRLLSQTVVPAIPVRHFQDLLRSGLQHHIERLFPERRQDVATVSGEPGEKKKKMKEKQQQHQQQEQNELAISVEGVAASGEEETSASVSSEEEEDGPGGLVGLIASLSGGGDEGSDVGALIGTLSGLITNLFGPGGLDIPGLLGTGTSLIAGLLGGDDNFGKVLGSYVGITIEGLSGGGADMNGAFFGNFLGALLAALSSDPEDESLPLRPKLFIENFFSGLQEAKRKDDPTGAGDDQGHQGGSDLFGFITHVVSSVVGGITSLVLNASLGSSGGSSQGSADASGASSSGSSGGGASADHHHR